MKGIGRNDSARESLSRCRRFLNEIENFSEPALRMRRRLSTRMIVRRRRSIACTQIFEHCLSLHIGRVRQMQKDLHRSR
jgi:hypothetical protein